MKLGDRVKKLGKHVPTVNLAERNDFVQEWVTGEVAAIGRAGWITIKWDDGTLESRHRNTVRRA